MRDQELWERLGGAWMRIDLTKAGKKGGGTGNYRAQDGSDRSTRRGMIQLLVRREDIGHEDEEESLVTSYNQRFIANRATW